MNLKPWREVIVPHKDVFEGNFQASEFAADLSKVAAKTASAEYQDPALFFERTFITEGMGHLLYRPGGSRREEGKRRCSEKGAPPHGGPGLRP